MTQTLPPHQLEDAVELHRRGDLVRASAAYRRLLSLDPAGADVLHLLATAGLQQLLTGHGLDFVRRALAAKDDFGEAHGTYGIAMQRQGRLEPALASFRKALALIPRSAEAHANLGSALQDALRPEQALASHDRAIAIAPQHVPWLVNRGLALQEMSLPKLALSMFNRAIALEPGEAGLLMNRGSVLGQLGYPEAVLCECNRALAGDPRLSSALHNRVLALQQMARWDEALVASERALKANPLDAEAHCGRGTLLSELRRFADAVRHFERAIASKPAYAEAFNNRANVLREIKRLREALTGYDRAETIRPDYAEAASNKIMGLDLDPATGFAEEWTARKRWFERHGRSLAGRRAAHENRRDPSRRIHVGYVSADFRNHSAAFLFGPILKRHDRTAIEVVCYSDVRRPDDRTREFERIADRWLTVRHLSDEALADQVRADGIDLLVDLAGHSAGNRLRTFALKPAPVQLTGWGYGAGTGVPTIDYLMSDPVQIPPTVRPYFAERILDLPCFIPFEPPAYAPDVQELPAFKTGAVTFGCFNQFVKVSDGMLGLWAQILREVPRSRLMLKDPALDDPSARAFALRALAANGIETSRVKLMGRTAHREHLDAYRNIDIALDPSPYGGGVTTWEALWMGCPVVTNIGRNAASTGTAAILFAIGLAGWTAENNDDYAALAIRGAADVRALAVIRAKLRTTIKASEAGNPDLYVRAVDAAFRDVWRKWCEEG